MATGFIRKNWQKDATSVLVKAGIRGVGAIAGAVIANKVFGEGKSKTLINLGGPILLAAGVLGDMMLENGNIRAGFQGLSTYALMRSIAVISPSEQDGSGLSDKLAISGLGVNQPAQLFNGVGGALGETSADYTGLTPQEFALANGEKEVVDTDGKTYYNDWAYLAENIDDADKIVKTVNGVDVNYAQQAADLMGVEDPAEAAKLMGIF